MSNQVEVEVIKADFDHTIKWRADDLYKESNGFRDDKGNHRYCYNCPVSSALTRLGYTQVSTGYSISQGTKGGVVYEIALPEEAQNLINYFDSYQTGEPLKFTATEEPASHPWIET